MLDPQVREMAERLDAIGKQLADIQRTLYYILAAVVVLGWAIIVSPEIRGIVLP